MAADQDEDQDEDEDDEGIESISSSDSDIELVPVKDKDDDLFKSADPKLAALLAATDESDQDDDAGDTLKSDYDNLKVSMSGADIEDLMEPDGGSAPCLEADAWRLLNAKKKAEAAERLKGAKAMKKAMKKTKKAMKKNKTKQASKKPSKQEAKVKKPIKMIDFKTFVKNAHSRAYHKECKYCESTLGLSHAEAKQRASIAARQVAKFYNDQKDKGTFCEANVLCE